MIIIVVRSKHNISATQQASLEMKPDKGASMHSFGTCDGFTTNDVKNKICGVREVRCRSVDVFTGSMRGRRKFVQRSLNASASIQSMIGDIKAAYMLKKCMSACATLHPCSSSNSDVSWTYQKLPDLDGMMRLDTIEKCKR